MKWKPAFEVLVTAATTVGGTIAVKAAAVRWLSGHPPVDLFGGTVRLRLTENPGAFLGLGAPLPESARFAAFVLGVGLALLLALAWALLHPELPLSRRVAAALVIGGGLANLLDRLGDGLVTDYVVLSAGPLHTGVFNVADVAILAGAILWLAPAGRSRRD